MSTSQYIFVAGSEVGNGDIRIDGIGPCGRAFKDVARISEPDSVNPILTLNHPLGINGVEQIVKDFRKVYPK